MRTQILPSDPNKRKAWAATVAEVSAARPRPLPASERKSRRVRILGKV